MTQGGIERDGDGPMGPSRMRLSKPVIAAIEAGDTDGPFSTRERLLLRATDELLAHLAGMVDRTGLTLGGLLIVSALIAAPVASAHVRARPVQRR